MTLGLLWLLGCAAEPGPTLAPLPAGTPEAAYEACRAEPVPQLKAGTCVDAAAQAARAGRQDLAGQACAELERGTQWWSECHFRAGEELGKAGLTASALSHCGLSGRYARFCLTHAGWGLPAKTETDAQYWVDLAVQTMPEELWDEASDVLRARWWFNCYYGTGYADPQDAKAAPKAEAAHARGAWALEIARLTGGDLALAAAVWQGALTSPRGEPLPEARRVGRYDVGAPVPGEEALPKVRTFGDAKRLVGETVDEDLVVAWLEALHFDGRTTGEAFLPYLDDPRPRVRYTAFRWFRVLPSADPEGTLRRYAQDADPVVRAHVADALAYQTWKGKPRRPGG